MTFGDLVKCEREAAKLTQSGFANGLNCYIADPREHYSSAAVCTWEQNQYIPYFSRLETVYHRAPAGSWQRAFADKALRYFSVLPVGEGQGRGDETPSPG